MSEVKKVNSLYFTNNFEHTNNKITQTKRSNIERRIISLCQLWCPAYEMCHEISINVVCATSKASDQPAHTQS